MDLFTHVLVAYLLTFGIVGFQPSYLAAGALAGGLPDGDIFLLPLWRRFPILRHHGITHSILGVTVVAVVGGALIAPHLAPGNPWIYLIVMEAGGLAHILMDGFTNFAVPPLMPFSARKLEIDADRAVNFLTMVVSIASFYLLLGVERNHVAFWIYLDTVYALMAFFVAYFAIRLAGRALVRRPLREMGPGSVPVPVDRSVLLGPPSGGAEPGARDDDLSPVPARARDREGAVPGERPHRADPRRCRAGGLAGGSARAILSDRPTPLGAPRRHVPLR